MHYSHDSRSSPFFSASLTNAVPPLSPFPVRKEISIQPSTLISAPEEYQQSVTPLTHPPHQAIVLLGGRARSPEPISPPPVSPQPAYESRVVETPMGHPTEVPSEDLIHQELAPTSDVFLHKSPQEELSGDTESSIASSPTPSFMDRETDKFESRPVQPNSTDPPHPQAKASATTIISSDTLEKRVIPTLSRTPSTTSCSSSNPSPLPSPRQRPRTLLVEDFNQRKSNLSFADVSIPLVNMPPPTPPPSPPRQVQHRDIQRSKGSLKRFSVPSSAIVTPSRPSTPPTRASPADTIVTSSTQPSSAGSTPSRTEQNSTPESVSRPALRPDGIKSNPPAQVSVPLAADTSNARLYSQTLQPASIVNKLRAGTHEAGTEASNASPTRAFVVPPSSRHPQTPLAPHIEELHSPMPIPAAKASNHRSHFVSDIVSTTSTPSPPLPPSSPPPLPPAAKETHETISPIPVFPPPRNEGRPVLEGASTAVLTHSSPTPTPSRHPRHSVPPPEERSRPEEVLTVPPPVHNPHDTLGSQAEETHRSSFSPVPSEPLPSRPNHHHSHPPLPPAEELYNSSTHPASSVAMPLLHASRPPPPPPPPPPRPQQPSFRHRRPQIQTPLLTQRDDVQHHAPPIPSATTISSTTTVLTTRSKRDPSWRKPVPQYTQSPHSSPHQSQAYQHVQQQQQRYRQAIPTFYPRTHDMMPNSAKRRRRKRELEEEPERQMDSDTAEGIQGRRRAADDSSDEYAPGRRYRYEQSDERHEPAPWSVMGKRVKASHGSDSEVESKGLFRRIAPRQTDMEHLDRQKIEQSKLLDPHEAVIQQATRAVVTQAHTIKLGPFRPARPPSLDLVEKEIPDRSHELPQLPPAPSRQAVVETNSARPQRSHPKPVTRKIPPSYVISAPIPITVADAALNALPLPSSITSDLASSVVPTTAKFTNDISHALQGPISSLAKLTRWNDEVEKPTKGETSLFDYSGIHKRVEGHAHDRHVHLGAANQFSAPDDRTDGRDPAKGKTQAAFRIDLVNREAPPPDTKAETETSSDQDRGRWSFVNRDSASTTVSATMQNQIDQEWTSITPISVQPMKGLHPPAIAQERDSKNFRGNIVQDFDMNVNQFGRSADGRTKNMEGTSTRQEVPDRKPPTGTSVSGKAINDLTSMLPPTLPFATARTPSPIPAQSSRPSMLVSSDIPRDMLSPPKRQVPEEILRAPTPPQAAHYIKTRKRSDDEGVMKSETGVPWMEGLAVHTIYPDTAPLDRSSKDIPQLHQPPIESGARAPFTSVPTVQTGDRMEQRAPDSSYDLPQRDRTDGPRRVLKDSRRENIKQTDPVPIPSVHKSTKRRGRGNDTPSDANGSSNHGLSDAETPHDAKPFPAVQHRASPESERKHLPPHPPLRYGNLTHGQPSPSAKPMSATNSHASSNLHSKQEYAQPTRKKYVHDPSALTKENEHARRAMISRPSSPSVLNPVVPEWRQLSSNTEPMTSSPPPVHGYRTRRYESDSGIIDQRPKHSERAEKWNRDEGRTHRGRKNGKRGNVVVTRTKVSGAVSIWQHIEEIAKAVLQRFKLWAQT